ncbi:MAG: glucokinase [Cyanobacteria bacterium P01_G01_bin.4]
MTQLVLSGDIGGTKTILRLTRLDLPPSNPVSNLHQTTFSSAAFADLVPMVEQFLDAATQRHPSILGTLDRADNSPCNSGDEHPIIAACFAIAGPVVNNTSRLTNLSWQLSAERLQAELGIARVELINDFAAIGYGVTTLPPHDLCTLQIGTSVDRAPIAVLGAGTGLGETYLTWQGDRYQVHASEGGHTNFAPRTPLQQELLNYLTQRHGRVSVERVVSGQGIVAIYQFLRDRSELARSRSSAEALPNEIPHETSGEASKSVAQAVRAWEQSREGDAGAAIGRAALANTDPLSVQTLEIFADLYGSEAGDLALKLLPLGGLYVAGGIAPKILPFLQSGQFRQAFLDKGRLQSAISSVPVHVVLNPEVGSIGAALRAAQLGCPGRG